MMITGPNMSGKSVKEMDKRILFLRKLIDGGNSLSRQVIMAQMGS